MHRVRNLLLAPNSRVIPISHFLQRKKFVPKITEAGYHDQSQLVHVREGREESFQDFNLCGSKKENNSGILVRNSRGGSVMPVTGQLKSNESSEHQWQAKLLPFMIRMLVGLTIFFLTASFIQLIYLHTRIGRAPALPAGALSNPLTANFHLEEHIIDLRYHQANVFLMSRVWTNYLGFVTGMTLALVGAAFILGKLRSPSTTIEGRAEGAELSLKTASPGIILAVLGVVLMMTTIIVWHPIETKDVPVYVGPKVQPRESLMPPPTNQSDHTSNKEGLEK